MVITASQPSVNDSVRVRLYVARGILESSIRMVSYVLQIGLMLRRNTLGLPVSSHRGGHQQRALGKNDRFQREGCDEAREMLTAWQRTQQSPSSGQERRCWEENVRTWERECGSEQQDVYREAFSLDAERVIKALVSTLLDSRCLFGRSPSSAPSVVQGGLLPCTHASKQGERRVGQRPPCCNKSGVRKKQELERET
jgi:hypothetical protein